MSIIIIMLPVITSLTVDRGVNHFHNCLPGARALYVHTSLLQQNSWKSLSTI